MTPLSKLSIVAVVVAFLVVVAIGVIVAAARAPRQRSARHEARIPEALSVVRAVVEDVDSQPRWRKDIASVTRTSATTFVERDHRGAETTFTRVPSSPDEVVLTFEGQGFSGHFRVHLIELRDTEPRTTSLVVEETVQMQGAVAALMASLAFDLDAFVLQWIEDVRAEAARRAASLTAGGRTPTPAARAR
jgi:hypothetical protein